MAAVGRALPRAQFVASPTSGLRRERLLAALHADPVRVALLTAPAGSGKTTLLAQAAAGHSTTAWWHVDAADGSAAAVHRGLGGALTLALEGRPRAVRSREELFALLEQHGRGLTLVLDDGHALSGTAAETELGRFLQLLPPGVRVWIASRIELSAVAASLRLRGQLIELTGDDLRFRSWEVEELFRDCYTRRLPPEDIAALTRYTDGWAAGLQMFHLATRDKSLGERQQAVTSLLGRSRMLRSYLLSTVLDALPPETLDFLIRASALVILRPALCDALLNRHDSATVLNDLADRNIFTMATADGWEYRFHSVLQVQLEAMLIERLGRPGARAWYQHAAAILEADGQWAAAYRARAHAEDRPGASALLRHHGADLHAPAVPRDDDPWVTLADSQALAADGRFGAAAAGFAAAARQFGDPHMQQTCRDHQSVTQAWSPQPAPDRPGPGWTSRLRSVISGDVGAASGPPASDLTEPGSQLARGLAIALAGAPLTALPALRQVAGTSTDAVALLARLACSVIEAVLGRTPTWPAEAVEPAAAEAGLPALATAARALRSRSNPSTLDTIRVECAARENYWGALFAALCGVLSALENDREITDAMAHDLHAQARRLGVTAGIDRLLAAARQPQALPRLRSAAADRPELSLRCFGEFSVRAGNRVLDCSALRPRARSAFRLLAMNVGQVVHEETIIAALWPDLPPVSARRNLQVAVSAVRGILDTGREPERRSVVERRGGGYVLNLPEGSDSDVLTFSRAIRQWRTGAGGRPGQQGRIRSLLTTALNAYSGELLPEEGQAEWVVAERQRLQFDAADAAVALAELEIGAGNTATASRACRRALQLEPHNDAAWRLLISAYERAGDLAAQVRARRDYAAVLAELGVPESSPREEFHLGDRRGQPGARASA